MKKEQRMLENEWYFSSIFVFSLLVFAYYVANPVFLLIHNNERSSSLISLKNIKKTYKTGSLIQKALDDVSLDLRDNEFVAILGPSGSGKTTMLNILGGLDRYDSGDLIINGISTKNYKERDWDSYRNHSVGFVFQSYNLIPHQTILSNVELALTISGISRKERRERAIAALDAVGLKEQMHKKPNQLSGGQMQRVSLARALVNNPDILLADEPTGALDSETSRQVMDLLKDVAKDRLVVMVTHNPELAQEYANRIVRVKDGKIISDTRPVEPKELAAALPAASAATTAAAADVRPETQSEGGGSGNGNGNGNDESNTAGINENPKENHKPERTSMSFLTALSLSFNNLKTKKARTFLVSFAGSIGIIGIALIVSMSNGVSKYINSIEQDTLSEYPITVQKVTSTSNMAMMAENMDKKEKDGDYVTETQLVGSYTGSQKVNDLKAFRSFLESGQSDIDDYARAVTYEYGITPQIYRIDSKSDNIYQVCPDPTIATMLGSNSVMMSYLGSSDMMERFHPLPDKEELYEPMYDLKEGHWPENDTEAVLVLSDSGSIADLTLYSLGLKPHEELEEALEAISEKKQTKQTSAAKDWNYSDFMGINFKVVSSADYYVYDKDFGAWQDKSENADYLKKIVDNGQDLTIVGVVQPKDNTSINPLTPGIYYSADLIPTMMKKAGESEIVKEQLDHPEINVLTGKKFGEPADEDSQMGSLFSVDEDAFASAFNINASNLSMDPGNFSSISLDLSGLDLETILQGTDLSTLLPSLDADTLNKLLEGVKIDTSAKTLQQAFTAVYNDYASWLESNGQGGLTDMANGMAAYLQSAQVKDYLQEQIQSILDNAASPEQIRAMLNAMLTELMEGYANFATSQPDPSDFRTNFAAWLQSADAQNILNKYSAQIQQMLADVTISSDQISQIAAHLSDGYSTWAKENGYTSPDDLNRSFQEYLNSERGRNVIASQVSTIIDTDTLQKNLQKILSESMTNASASLKPQLEKVMESVMNQIAGSLQSSLGAAMGNLSGNLASAFSFNPDALADAFKMNMSEDDLMKMMTSMSSASSNTFDNNLKKLGYADIDDPYQISIYPVDFEAKSEIDKIIENYNTRVTDAGQSDKTIAYTDMVGTMMSSVNTIINTISYVLIGFVSVSLVVSSIMIGVITYISVLERRKEIGILRSIGASKHNISEVFNAETFIIGLLAGLIGIGISVLLLIPLNMLIHHLTGNPAINASLPVGAALILIALSVVLTYIGGLIPSKKAANSDPVTALRTE